MSAATAITAGSSVALAAIASVLALFGGNIVFGDSSFAPVFIDRGSPDPGWLRPLILAYFSGIGDNCTFVALKSSPAFYRCCCLSCSSSVSG